MRIGTTATHTFELPTNYLDAGYSVNQVKVIYAQDNVQKFAKEFSSVTNNQITVDLNVDQVGQFSPNKLARIQIYILAKATGKEDKVYSSDIMTIKVHEGLAVNPFGEEVALAEEE